MRIAVNKFNGIGGPLANADKDAPETTQFYQLFNPNKIHLNPETTRSKTIASNTWQLRSLVVNFAKSIYRPRKEL